MKTQLIKTITLALAISTACVSFGDDKKPGTYDEGTGTTLNSVPSVGNRGGNPFDEGTETTLNSQQLGEIQVWAANSKLKLVDLLETIRTMPYGRAKQTLMQGFMDIVPQSAPKTTETLMRFVLNRALMLVGKIDMSADSARPGIVDQEIRILTRSAELAIEYYESDLAYINGQAGKSNPTALPYKEFGIKYAEFLMQVNESLVNAAAQYNVALTVLGFLQVDLDRDLNRTQYAPEIVRIHSFLAHKPLKMDCNDGRAIQLMREVRQVYIQTLADMGIQSVLTGRDERR